LIKRKSKKAITLSASEMTAQRFVNVKDVQGNVLYTKDNHVFAYIRLQPITVDLLSNNEKKVLLDNLTSELSTLDKPFKFFCISRPVDISKLIDEMMDLYVKSDDDLQRELLEQEMKVYQDFAMSGDVIERQFYVIIWDKWGEEACNELLKRAKDLVSKFRSCGITIELLKDEQIIQLCNQFTNPQYAFKEGTDVTPTIPSLKTERLII